MRFIFLNNTVNSVTGLVLVAPLKKTEMQISNRYDRTKHKSVCNSVSHTDTELKCDVVVAEHRPQDIL